MSNIYPAFPQWVGTKFTPRFGIQERIATNGAVRLRSLQTSPKFDITLLHGILDQDDRDTLVQFYQDNRTSTVLVNVAEDGSQRTMVFAGAGYQIEGLDSGLYKATVFFREI